MIEKAIANASPLILLSRAGHEALFKIVADVILVPEPVALEIRARGEKDPTAGFLLSTSWVSIVPAISVPDTIIEWGLGRGESSVIALGLKHPTFTLLLDDLPARKCASSLNLPIRGTLGIVLLAKRKGKIRSARTVLEDLLKGGMYLSRSVFDSVLALVGE